MTTVLIVSPPEDTHAMLVGWSLERQGHAVQFWDTRDAIQGRGHSVSMSPGAPTRVTVQHTEFDAAWLRRVHWPNRIRFGVAEEDSKYAFDESRKYFDNVMERLSRSPCRFLNPRASTIRGEMKIEQLHACRELGIKFPETLISSDPDEIRAFVHRHRVVAVKPIDVHTWKLPDGGSLMTYTNTITAADIDGMSDASLMACPVIYQRCIQKVHDVRVVAVGDKVFACRLDSPSGTTDFRPFQGTDDLRFSRMETPEPLARAMLSLTDYFSLQLASSDFVVDEAGEFYFLDLNPGGAYLFVEFHTGYPITAHVAAMLGGGDPDEYPGLHAYNEVMSAENAIGAV